MRNQPLWVIILSYQVSLVIRPVPLPKLYLSCLEPSAFLLILQLHIAFLIITSPLLFKIYHSSMLPAVVFFPNALYLQEKKKTKKNKTKKKKKKHPKKQILISLNFIFTHCFSAPETNGRDCSLL